MRHNQGNDDVIKRNDDAIRKNDDAIKEMMTQSEK